MVTYVVGTDGSAASDSIGDYLEPRIEGGDRVEVVTVLTGREGVRDRDRGEALDACAARLADAASVTTHRLEPTKRPARLLVDYADRVDADQIVIGLRRHSQTERIVFGSVAYAVLKITERPVTLVPLLEAQSTDEEETRDLKYMY